MVLIAAMLMPSAVVGSSYKEGEKVVMYVNKVGPYFNPQETYHYYSLPVCRPDKVEHKSLSLGEVLDGDRMAVSMYQIDFKESFDRKEVCTVTLGETEVDQLEEAIEDLYYFEFVYDEIPIRGFVGHLEEGPILPHNHKTYLWTHLHFTFEYNQNQVISANVTSMGLNPLSLTEVMPPFPATFTYSAKWFPTDTKYSDRGTRQQKFFPQHLEIHWLSIVNSIILVFLLLGFVVLILLRVLKSDFARYNLTDEDGDEMDQDDNGWKIVNTDVFRFPSHKSILSAILGNGSQFLTLGFGIIFLALLGFFNVHRHHSMNSASVLLYALTCCVAGFVSSRFFRQLGGKNWVWNIVLTGSLFAVPFFVVWSVVNSVAWYHGSTQALPFTTIVLLMFIWLIVGFPLTVLGGICGKNTAGAFDAPCRTKNIAREIPPCPWYRSLTVHMAIGGFLPFSAISVELYYIFATVWGREAYTLYGVLLVVFFILISVTACISVALTYFQLSSEDYRWWWRSVFSSGSTGLFVLVYGIFYYYKRSSMYGTLQTVEYFGYTLLACYVFFLMLGTISFWASLTFVRYIYRNLKMD